MKIQQDRGITHSSIVREKQSETHCYLFLLNFNSQEEIESLRERMSAQTSLVVIGSADDALRINKFNRHLEGVTQSMVDNMIAVMKINSITLCYFQLFMITISIIFF